MGGETGALLALRRYSNAPKDKEVLNMMRVTKKKAEVIRNGFHHLGDAALMYLHQVNKKEEEEI